MQRSSLAAVALVAAGCLSQLMGRPRTSAPGLAHPPPRPPGFQVSEVMQLYTDCDFAGGSYLVRQPLPPAGISPATVLRNSRYVLAGTSSLRVKPGAYTVRLYQQAGLAGRSYEVKDWQVSCLPPDWNDKVQSIGVTPCFIFYQDANFQTPLFTDPGHAQVRPMPGPRANDQVSSVRIPPGWTLTLFEHAAGKGRQVVLRNDVADLSKLNFNDITSSFLPTNPRVQAMD